MKLTTLVLTAGLLAGLHLAAQAAGVQVMVLSAQGAGTVITADGKSESLKPGQLVEVGSTIDLPDHAQATLLVLPEGTRKQAAPKSKLKVTAQGLTALSGSLTNQEGPPLTLVTSGKNMRHMGGQAVRGPVWSQFKESPISHVQVELVSTSPTMARLTFDSSQGGPIEALVKPDFPTQELTMVGGSLGLHVHDESDEAMPPPDLGQASLTPKPAAGRFHYEAQLALSDTSPTCGLELRSGDGLLLHTRFRLLTPEEKQALQQAVAQAKAWAAQAPNDPQPYVMLMALYDDFDMVEEALESGQQALQRNPKDSGLLQQLSRLALDVGRRAEAEKYFRAAHEK